MSNPNKPLEIHDLTVSYQRKPVLYGIDLEIELSRPTHPLISTQPPIEQNEASSLTDPVLVAVHPDEEISDMSS